jgi:DNA-binding CsgD family transcriptional regulator
MDSENGNERIGLMPADHQQNEQGFLSPRQEGLLRQQRWVRIMGAIAFVGLVLVLLGAIVWKIAQPSFVSRGQLFIGVPLGLFWLWVLWPSFSHWRQVNQDLHEGKVATLEGLLRYDMALGLGMWQQVKYEIHVRGRKFRVNRSTYLQLQNQATYRVIFAPHSGLFLGAQRVDESLSMPVTTPTPPPRAPISPDSLPDPLKTQEIEILRLIAAGYANKEIAQELSLSVNTIKMYTTQIYRKLSVQRRTEAVARGRELGLL